MGNLATSPAYRAYSTPSSRLKKWLRSLPQKVQASRGFADDKISTYEKSINILLLTEPYLELESLKDPQRLDPWSETLEERFSKEQARAIIDELKLQISSLSGAESYPVSSIDNLVSQAFDKAELTQINLTVEDLLEPLLRCLTASLYRDLLNHSTTDVSWLEIEALIREVLEEHLSGGRGWGEDIAKQASNLLLSDLTGVVRDLFTPNISPFIGDVLVYMGQREAILKKFAEKVDEFMDTTSEPLWLVGHSLGGIICYDYCTQTSRQVDRLITVGSQVGLLGEFGALKNQSATTPFPVPIPDNIVRWINIYDPDDMLSFVAEPIFANQPRKVEDIEIDTQAPMPICHGEYWNCQRVYQQFL